MPFTMSHFKFLGLFEEIMRKIPQLGKKFFFLKQKK